MDTPRLLWLGKQRMPLSQVELFQSRRVDWDVVVEFEVAISGTKGHTGTFPVQHTLRNFECRKRSACVDEKIEVSASGVIAIDKHFRLILEGCFQQIKEFAAVVGFVV